MAKPKKIKKNNNMSEAEKKWEAFFDKKTYPLKPYNDGSGRFWTPSNGEKAISDISDYKKALRSAIEDRIKQLNDDRDDILVDKYWRIHSSDEMPKILSKKTELNFILGFLDSVTPKE